MKQLLGCYLSERNLMTELTNLKLVRCENNFTKYLEKYTSLTNRIRNLTTTLKRFYFIDGLPSYIQKDILAQNPENLSDVISLAKKMYDINIQKRKEEIVVSNYARVKSNNRNNNFNKRFNNNYNKNRYDNNNQMRFNRNRSGEL